MAEAIILGTVALKEPGKLLEWNHKKMKFTNMKEANKHLSRPYRKGWEVGGFKA
jgi:hypothetical protein